MSLWKEKTHGKDKRNLFFAGPTPLPVKQQLYDLLKMAGMARPATATEKRPATCLLVTRTIIILLAWCIYNHLGVSRFGIELEQEKYYSVLSDCIKHGVPDVCSTHTGSNGKGQR